MACTYDFLYRLTVKQRRDIVDELMKEGIKNGDLKKLQALLKKYKEKMDLLKSIGAEIKYAVDEKDNYYNHTRTEVGVFDTKEEAEAAAYKLADSYKGYIVDKEIAVLQVFKRNMQDKDDLRPYSILGKELTIFVQ